jgi:hypothetical protein
MFPWNIWLFLTTHHYNTNECTCFHTNHKSNEIKMNNVDFSTFLQYRIINSWNLGAVTSSLGLSENIMTASNLTCYDSWLVCVHANRPCSGLPIKSLRNTT